MNRLKRVHRTFKNNGKNTLKDRKSNSIPPREKWKKIKLVSPHFLEYISRRLKLAATPCLKTLKLDAEKFAFVEFMRVQAKLRERVSWEIYTPLSHTRTRAGRNVHIRVYTRLTHIYTRTWEEAETSM